MGPPPDRYLKISQAAAMAGVKVPTIRAWCDRNLVASTRTPYGQRLVDEKSLRALLEKRRSAG